MKRISVLFLALTLILAACSTGPKVEKFDLDENGAKASYTVPSGLKAYYDYHQEYYGGIYTTLSKSDVALFEEGSTVKLNKNFQYYRVDFYSLANMTYEELKNDPNYEGAVEKAYGENKALLLEFPETDETVGRFVIEVVSEAINTSVTIMCEYSQDGVAKEDVLKSCEGIAESLKLTK